MAKKTKKNLDYWYHQHANAQRDNNEVWAEEALTRIYKQGRKMAIGMWGADEWGGGLERREDILLNEMVWNEFPDAISKSMHYFRPGTKSKDGSVESVAFQTYLGTALKRIWIDCKIKLEREKFAGDARAVSMHTPMQGRGENSDIHYLFCDYRMGSTQENAAASELTNNLIEVLERLIIKDPEAAKGMRYLLAQQIVYNPDRPNETRPELAARLHVGRTKLSAGLTYIKKELLEELGPMARDYGEDADFFDICMLDAMRRIAKDHMAQARTEDAMPPTSDCAVKAAKTARAGRRASVA